MTLSEEFFDKYLNSRKIKFEVEMGVLVHPDRILHFPNKEVTCEIRQLERGKNEPINYVGSVDPYKKLRKAIKRKTRQGGEAKQSKTPYVIVLFNYNSRQIMSSFVVEGAMYGDVAIVIDIPQDPKQKGKVRGNFFSANGILRHARSHKEPGQPFNQRVSAVAILDIINPTQNVFDEEFKKASVGIDTKKFHKLFKIAGEVERRLKREGKYDDTLQVQRLRVFHNFYATNPLGFDVFNGKHDEQYFINPVTGMSMAHSE